jgi:hypothetical protein
MITFEKWLPYLTKEERAEYDVLQTLSLDAWAPGYTNPSIPVGGRLSRLAKEAYDRLKADTGIVEDDYRTNS